MIDKYEDYPNGVSDLDIQESDLKGLARILEILTDEYVDNVNRELHDKEEYAGQLAKYKVFASTFVSLINSWNDLPLSDKEKCLQISIFTGSLLEATLQLFLLVHRNDFEASNWRIWHVVENEKTVEFDFDLIRKRLKETTKSLQDEGVIRKKQREDLNDAILDELKMRQNGRAIKKMMLDELVRLFEHERIFDTRIPDENGTLVDDDEKSGKNLIAKMDKIREGRNNVHVFADYDIPTPEESIESIRVLCSILSDILFRVRCLDDEQRKEAFRELVLGIPEITLVDVDDEYNVVGIHKRKTE